MTKKKSEMQDENCKVQDAIKPPRPLGTPPGEGNEEKPEVAEAGDSAEATDGKMTTPPVGHPSGEGNGEAPECPSTEVPGSDKNIMEDLVESLVERAREVFGMHTADEIYFTSDGQAFTEEQHARAHAGWLKDETVVTVKRTEV